jgi:hypothetical protein
VNRGAARPLSSPRRSTGIHTRRGRGAAASFRTSACSRRRFTVIAL